ncbi:MAG TPA: ferritin family protein [Clostridiales bacterium]|nr:ferritin family protein [Clostridiales bacterium]HQP70632.1 ferritin family protein [Clostridiales bacterium]
MENTGLNSIIDFAIDREKEAVEFYTALQEKTKFAGVRDMLKELAAMETGHISVLNSIRTKGIDNISIQQIKNLHISDYMVEKEPSQDMDYQDILIIAMKREEKSKALYEDLAVRFEDSPTGKLFSKIAAEESDHKLKFEKLYDETVLKEN